MKRRVGLRRPGRTSTRRAYSCRRSRPDPSSTGEQAAEKAAKAYLTFHDVLFRKTYDLKELGGQCATLNPSLAPLLKEASDLTDYAVVFRYLDAPREPDESEALVALETAARVFEQVSALLPLSRQSCDSPADLG